MQFSTTNKKDSYLSDAKICFLNLHFNTCIHFIEFICLLTAITFPPIFHMALSDSQAGTKIDITLPRPLNGTLQNVTKGLRIPTYI